MAIHPPRWRCAGPAAAMIRIASSPSTPLTNAIRGSGGAIVLVMYDEIQKILNPDYVSSGGE